MKKEYKEFNVELHMYSFSNVTYTSDPYEGEYEDTTTIKGGGSGSGGSEYGKEYEY